MEKIIFLLSLLVVPAFAETGPELFKAGNGLYADGKFADAAQKYQAAADAGLKNWVLEYNLGNAYFRGGQIGHAVLHFERAFRMNSGQGDVLYNLNLTTQKAGDPEIPTGALAMLAWRFFYILSINALTLLCSLVLIFFCVAAGFALAGRNFLRVELGVGLGIVMVGLVSWLAARAYLLEHPQGVVVTPVAEIRSGPNTTYPTNFTVPEGHRVIILDEQEPIQGWREIGVPQEGLKGWVPEASVEII